jgi:hypothetical protein
MCKGTNNSKVCVGNIETRCMSLDGCQNARYVDIAIAKPTLITQPLASLPFTFEAGSAS